MNEPNGVSVVNDSTCFTTPEKTRLDENALRALEDAARTAEFETDLLQTTPARDIRLKIEEVVALLNAADHQEFLKKQGWISGFTGADIEARLRFELASQSVVAKMDELRRAARNAQHISKLLNEAETGLHREQERLNTVIDNAQSLLSGPHDGDDFIRARFERRLSSLMAVNVANVSTIKQIELARQVLKTLLDRFLDVDTTLFPLWQRNVLALAQAEPGERRQAGNTLAQSKAQLILYLQQD